MCFVTTYLAFVRVRLKKLLTYLLTFVSHDCNKTIKRWTRFTLHCSGEPFACCDCKNARLRGNDKLHFQCLLALCLYRDTAVFLVPTEIQQSAGRGHSYMRTEERCIIIINWLYPLFGGTTDQGRHFNFFLGAKFFFCSMPPDYWKIGKKQHFICSNLTLFIVLSFFFSLFFSFLSLFSFVLSFFFFSSSGGGGGGGGDGLPAPQMTPQTLYRINYSWFVYKRRWRFCHFGTFYIKLKPCMVLQLDVFTTIAFPSWNDAASFTKLRRYGNNSVFMAWIGWSRENIAGAVCAKKTRFGSLLMYRYRNFKIRSWYHYKKIRIYAHNAKLK